MNRIPFLLILLVASCTGSEHGATTPSVPDSVSRAVPETFLTPLLSAQSIELSSIYPYDQDLEGELWEERGYTDLAQIGGFAVLGSVSFSNPAKADLLREFFDGIADSNGDVADCFNPRHALTVQHDGHRGRLLHLRAADPLASALHDRGRLHR